MSPSLMRRADSRGPMWGRMIGLLYFKVASSFGGLAVDFVDAFCESQATCTTFSQLFFMGKMAERSKACDSSERV